MGFQSLEIPSRLQLLVPSSYSNKWRFGSSPSLLIRPPLISRYQAAKGNAEVFVRLDEDIGTLMEGLVKPLQDSDLYSSDDLAELRQDVTELTK